MLKDIMKYGKAEFELKQIRQITNEPVLYNLFWETTLRCNAKCKHCGSRAGENVNVQDELTTEEIKNTLKKISEKTDASKILLNITGGEPLVREDLFDVMGYAVSLGYHWGITTNGMLMNDDVIKKMKETKLSTMSVSLDGLEESHDKFRGIKGSYKKIIDNIEKLKADKFLRCFQITTVVNKLNIGELEEMYKSTRLDIAPLRVGAGVKGKVVEAAYYQTPLVTTDIGGEGLDTSVGNMVIANDADGMAETIISLYEDYDRLREMSDAGRTFIEKYFTFENAEKILRKDMGL